MPVRAFEGAGAGDWRTRASQPMSRCVTIQDYNLLEECHPTYALIEAGYSFIMTFGKSFTFFFFFIEKIKFIIYQENY